MSSRYSSALMVMAQIVQGMTEFEKECHWQSETGSKDLTPAWY